MGKHRHSSERKKPFLVRNKDGISVGSRKSHTVASSSRKPPHDTEKTIQTHRSLTYRPSQSAETLPSGPWRDITLPVSPRPVARYVQALTSVPLSYETGPKYNPTGPPRESTASLNYPSRTLPEDDEENMVIVTFEPESDSEAGRPRSKHQRSLTRKPYIKEPSHWEEEARRRSFEDEDEFEYNQRPPKSATFSGRTKSHSPPTFSRSNRTQTYPDSRSGGTRPKYEILTLPVHTSVDANGNKSKLCIHIPHYGDVVYTEYTTGSFLVAVGSLKETWLELDPYQKSATLLFQHDSQYEDQEETHNQFQPDRVVGLSGENFWEYYSACLAEVDSDD
ncbi:hypothetical protein M231_07147 [Tremella mesenterica]|uniref:Uncharacterized protein n=1 Tax=Tremella mesenterica TaxID=5217 RepID=A0A4Q1BC61_TREME|nr:hypothetical protein M231_07147 [Tremella mesenterica]